MELNTASIVVLAFMLKTKAGLNPNDLVFCQIKKNPNYTIELHNLG
jgi:hypothetical protein